MNNEMEFYLQHTGTIKVSKMSRQDLKNLIDRGEGRFLEFKHKVSSPEKIARELAAFANTKGGTLLVGVEDNGNMIGTESFFEEEFWLNQAAKDVCVPEIPINIEMINIGHRDIIIVEVPEAEKKPIYVKSKKKRQVFIREGEESVLASKERVEILKNGSSDEGVTFEYGEKEQLLFRFLNEYGDINVNRYAIIANVTTYRAAKILVNLVSAGVLNIFQKDGVEHYTFAQKT